MAQGIMRRELQITDINEIKRILDKGTILHLGLVDGDEPYVVPMNYGYTLDEGKLTLYIHGATEGRKLDIMRVNPKIFFSIESDISPFEGRTACQYGTSYYSVMGKGTATILDKPEDKINGLSLFMKTQTGIDFEFNERLVSAVSVIKLDITEYAAKHRPKPVAMR
jgi:nitroimidazol reductase NimA-like FMN-containing flavoprotein (pyridoxamine 5'-phosphate oxidase superfamily)